MIAIPALKRWAIFIPWFLVWRGLVTIAQRFNAGQLMKQCEEFRPGRKNFFIR